MSAVFHSSRIEAVFCGRWRSLPERQWSCSGCSSARASSSTNRGCRLPYDLAFLEAERDLALGGVGAVRSVHRIALKIDRKILANGIGLGIDRIGRAHHRAVLGDGVL